MEKIGYAFSVKSRLKQSVYKCFCGNVFATSQYHVKIGKTKSCGCKTIELRIKSLTKHGKSRTKIYRIWASMKARCLNKNDKRYDSYGGRGISVFYKWISNFKCFYDYVSKLDGFNEKDDNGNRKSLDRIKNDGNYSPGNLRWSSYIEQSHNTGLRKDNKSGHKGIFFLKRANKWMASINYNHKTKYLGLFSKKSAAIKARKREELELLKFS